MKKTMVFLCVVSLVAFAVPAFADLFTNGGFETGNLAGWSVQYGTRDVGAETATWGSYPTGGNIAGVIGSDGKVATAGRTDNGSLPVWQTSTIVPYVGNYMAILNDSNGNYHATRISQTSTAITQQQLDDRTKIYVDYGAALVEPSNAANHSPNNFPYFDIDIYKNATLINTFHINSDAAAGAGWTNIGTMFYNGNEGIIYYKAGQFEFDLFAGGFASNDTIRIDLSVADCGLSGHGGYAFLDGIGTEQPPNPAPEPTTMLLLGLGLVGLAGFRKRS
jgi:hypothetical protein